MQYLFCEFLLFLAATAFLFGVVMAGAAILG